MKKNIPLLILFFLASIAIQAQDLTFDQASPIKSDFVFQDLTNNGLDLETKVAVTNNTSEVMDLKWVRIKIESVTEEEWQSQICDNITCYGYDTDTNYDPPITNTFTLQPGETFEDFALHVWPRMTSGCGQYKVLFSDISEPDNVIGELQFDVSVNTGSCTFTSTNEKEAVTDVVLYPNPSFGQFTLSENDVVKHLAIYNILGKKVMQTNYFNGDYVDVSGLADGMYLVALQNEDNQTLKTLRLSKRSLQP